MKMRLTFPREYSPINHRQRGNMYLNISFLCLIFIGISCSIYSEENQSNNNLRLDWAHGYKIGIIESELNSIGICSMMIKSLNLDQNQLSILFGIADRKLSDSEVLLSSASSDDLNREEFQLPLPNIKALVMGYMEQRKWFKWNNHDEDVSSNLKKLTNQLSKLSKKK
jgi:hypothetical protein